MSRSVAALAAQMAAGSGDASHIEFCGDAGELHSRDLAAALPNFGTSTELNLSTHSKSASTAQAPEKLRKAVSTASRKDQMIRLKASVLDVLSLLQSMCDDGDNRMKALHRRIGESHIECVQELDAFDDNFVWLDEVGFDIPRLMREARLALDTQWYQSYGIPIRTPEEHLVAEAFETVSTKLLLGREGEQFVADLRRDVTKLLFPLGDESTPEIMLALNNFTLTDVVAKTTSTLNESRDALAELKKRIDETEDYLTRSIQTENMSDAEKAEAELLGLTEKRLELCAKRVGALAADDSKKGGGALEQLDSIIKNPAVAKLLDEKSALKQTVTNDIRLLEDDRVEKLRENDSSISRYQSNVAASKRRIAQNHEEQHKKWVELAQIFRDLIALDREGERLVREHVVMTEVEQKRRQEHREYRDSYAKHRQVLDDLLTNTNAAIGFAEDLKAAILEGREKLIAARIEDTLKGLLKIERKNFLEAFELYGVKNQTSVSRAEKRLASFDRLLNDLAFVRKQCRDTGDDASTAYAKRINDIERLSRKCKKQSETLEDNFAKHEATYLRLEQIMLNTLGDLVPDDGTLLNLHVRIKSGKAEQFQRFVEQASGITQSNVSAAEEIKHRQQALSSEASALKAATDSKKAQFRSLRSSVSRSQLSSAGGNAAAEQSLRAAEDEDTINVSAIDVTAA